MIYTLWTPIVIIYILDASPQAKASLESTNFLTQPRKCVFVHSPSIFAQQRIDQDFKPIIERENLDILPLIAEEIILYKNYADAGDPTKALFVKYDFDENFVVRDAKKAEKLFSEILPNIDRNW